MFGLFMLFRQHTRARIEISYLLWKRFNAKPIAPEPILSEGQNGTIEAGLSAMLERIDHETGKVCHEEIIGDYPAAQAALSGHGNPDPQYDYKMVARHLLTL